MNMVYINGVLSLKKWHNNIILKVKMVNYVKKGIIFIISYDIMLDIWKYLIKIIKCYIGIINHS
jgi:hypothetical protein